MASLALTLGMTVLLVRLSAVSLPPTTESGGGLVRLSWRLRGDAVCRRPTPAELERLPAHMRDPDACMGRGSDWDLTVRVDDTEMVRDRLAPAGARGDRPVFVLRDVPVSPGRHRLDVVFDPVGRPGERGHRLERSVDVARGEVVLVTWDAEAERLVLREGATP
jgi:hypothetical protein